jgi:hypothetical protein
MVLLFWIVTTFLSCTEIFEYGNDKNGMMEKQNQIRCNSRAGCVSFGVQKYKIFQIYFGRDY